MCESSLLQHENPRGRFQAALIVALWGKEESVLECLQESYDHVDRSGKEKIIEALGHIGKMTAVPFLMQRLQEPHLSLRIMAATAILECLR